MEIQTLNKFDFKKYLLANLPDSRQEELIFWKKGIPLPIDLVYKIFDQRGDLLKSYLDHISSVYLYLYIVKKEGKDWEKEINSLPNEKNRNNVVELNELFKKYINNSNVIGLGKELAEKLFVVEYSFSFDNFISSLCHEGRKYKRLYLPLKLKEILKKLDPESLKCIGVSNGDMFGNVVADLLYVYRSGFSDAFAAIFNKLLDFVLEKSEGKQISISTASRIKISQVSEPEVSYSIYNAGRITDGSLWEPKYQDAVSSFILNNNHPYFEFINNKSGIEVLVDIASQFALIENETLKDSTSKVLEIFRQDLSRRLRLISEKN